MELARNRPIVDANSADDESDKSEYDSDAEELVVQDGEATHTFGARPAPPVETPAPVTVTQQQQQQQQQPSRMELRRNMRFWEQHRHTAYKPGWKALRAFRHTARADAERECSICFAEYPVQPASTDWRVARRVAARLGSGAAELVAALRATVAELLARSFESPDHDLVEVRCGHVFHRHCVSQWYTRYLETRNFAAGPTCPLCRQQMCCTLSPYKPPPASLQHASLDRSSSSSRGRPIGSSVPLAPYSADRSEFFERRNPYNHDFF
jgi:hypothetical protein